VLLHAGMKLIAYDEDMDDERHRDDLLVSGIVEPAPHWLKYNGSRLVKLSK
jgi:hypothetical protein